MHRRNTIALSSAGHGASVRKCLGYGSRYCGSDRSTGSFSIFRHFGNSSLGQIPHAVVSQTSRLRVYSEGLYMCDNLQHHMLLVTGDEYAIVRRRKDPPSRWLGQGAVLLRLGLLVLVPWCEGLNSEMPVPNPKPEL